jgi:hypothetical protein
MKRVGETVPTKRRPMALSWLGTVTDLPRVLRRQRHLRVFSTIWEARFAG